MKPVTVEIRVGHVLDVLRTMPAESVHCVVTSPPYWGLRDYKLEPQVWGDGQICRHDWSSELLARQAGGGWAVGNSPDGQKKDYDLGERSQGAFCIQCSAWRGSLGLEPTPDLYVAHLVDIFREVQRVLRKDGTLWCNLGDSYTAAPKGNLNGQDKSTLTSTRTQEHSPVGIDKLAVGLKPKDLVGIPWRVAFALQADGWWLRSDIIWSKPNPMPESVTDRPTKAHEYLFLLAKSERYYYDADAIREPFNFPERTYSPNTNNHKTARLEEQGNRSTSGLHDGRTQYGDPFLGRNRRTVWEIPTQPYPEAHFATFPDELVWPCIAAGSSEYGCCAECGAPWERVVEAEGGTIGKSWHNHEDDLARGMRGGDDGHNIAAAAYRTYRRVEKGWQPTCAHGGDPVHCTVLDPFAGSGTTMMVAAKNGRNAIGIDLQRDYVPMMRQRLAELETDLVHPTTVRIMEQAELVR